jgi:hypothetical protein
MSSTNSTNRKGTPQIRKMNTQSQQELPADEPVGTLEPVAYFNGPMPIGVTVLHKGRIFINFPKWGDEADLQSPNSMMMVIRQPIRMKQWHKSVLLSSWQPQAPQCRYKCSC